MFSGTPCVEKRDKGGLKKCPFCNKTPSRIKNVPFVTKRHQGLKNFPLVTKGHQWLKNAPLVTKRHQELKNTQTPSRIKNTPCVTKRHQCKDDYAMSLSTCRKIWMDRRRSGRAAAWARGRQGRGPWDPPPTGSWCRGRRWWAPAEPQVGSQTKIERNKLNKLLIILFILKNNPVGLAENKRSQTESAFWL